MNWVHDELAGTQPLKVNGVSVEERDKECHCYVCKKDFHSLGIARHRAMHRDKKEMCIISLVVLIALMLQGCSTVPVTQYQSPYSIEEVKQAEKYVRSVTEVSWIKIRKYGAVNQFGDIRLYSGLTGQYREDIRHHEVSHLYELYVLGIPWEDTKSHKNWLRSASI